MRNSKAAAKTGEPAGALLRLESQDAFIQMRFILRVIKTRSALRAGGAALTRTCFWSGSARIRTAAQTTVSAIARLDVQA